MAKRKKERRAERRKQQQGALRRAGGSVVFASAPTPPPSPSASRRALVGALLVSTGVCGGLATPAYGREARGTPHRGALLVQAAPSLQAGGPAWFSHAAPAASGDASGTSGPQPDGTVRGGLSPGASCACAPGPGELLPLAGADTGRGFVDPWMVAQAEAPDDDAASTDERPILLPGISVRGQSPEEAYKPEEVSSPKYTEPLRDIPQSITVVPEAVIEEQGATTLRDVLRNVPGITFQAGEGGAPHGDNLNVRGFSARNDLFVDGARDFGPVSRDPFNLEQVEVVKGPGSAYTGRGSTGGTVNLVSKTPGLTPFVDGSVGAGTDETKRVTLDVNQPLGGIGLDGAAVRLNAMFHDSEVAGRDVVENRRWGVAPSLSLGLGSPTRVTLGYFHLSQDNVPDLGIPWVPGDHSILVEYRNRPAPVSRDNFYGLASLDHEDTDSDITTLRIEHDVSESIGLRNQTRYGRTTLDSISTAPRFVDSSSLVIRRGVRSWITDDRILDNQTDLTARFSTGPAGHALVVGVDVARETSERERLSIDGAPNTSLFDPDPYEPFTGTIAPRPGRSDLTAESVGVYAFDTVTLGERWEVSGGVRWDRFDVEGVDLSGVTVDRIDRMLSWRAGLVYKPAPNGSIYAAYGTSFNPSLEGLSLQRGDAAVDPERSRTYEVGSKWDLFDARLSVTGAVFRTEKTNARTPSLLPGDQPDVLEGEQRVDGFEVGVAGSITRDWQVFAGYTFLDSEVVRSNDPAEVGNELRNTPRNSLSLWTTYRLPFELVLGAGANFVDSRYSNETNERQVDGYWLFDAMAAYPLTEQVELRLNVYNLTDEEYFDRVGGGHVIPGAGRSALLTADVRF